MCVETERQRDGETKSSLHHSSDCVHVSLSGLIYISFSACLPVYPSLRLLSHVSFRTCTLTRVLVRAWMYHVLCMCSCECVGGCVVQNWSSSTWMTKKMILYHSPASKTREMATLGLVAAQILLEGLHPLRLPARLWGRSCVSVFVCVVRLGRL